MKIHPIEKANLARFGHILSIDESGRGPLAGPVTVAGVLLNGETLKMLEDFDKLNDSKKMSHKIREILENKIKNAAISYSTVDVPCSAVDDINIYEATKLGIVGVCNNIIDNNQNIDNLGILIDGNFSNLNIIFLDNSAVNFNVEFIVKGDSMCPSIAAASILAKQHRDRLMNNLHKQYPLYEFDKHKGYGTRTHLQKLELYGPCDVHRNSFAPIKMLCDGNNIIMRFFNELNLIHKKRVSNDSFRLYYQMGVCLRGSRIKLRKNDYYHVKIGKRVALICDIVGKDNKFVTDIKLSTIANMKNETFGRLILELRNIKLKM